MCSVVGCESSGRSAQRFTLPEDPERRLEWVQFLLEVNGQRLKESSWTDITMCREHFKDDCFIRLFPSGTVQLKPSAVPSVFVRPETNKPEESVESLDCEPNAVPTPRVKAEPEEPEQSPQSLQPVEVIKVACQSDVLVSACGNQTSYPEKAKHTLRVSCSPAASEAEQKDINRDLKRKKAALLQMKGKYVVNEKCLLQLFQHKCPSCGCKLHMEKITCGLLVVFNQRCLRCEYRNQWKNQVNARVPTAEDATLETRKAVPTDDNSSSAVFSEIVTFSDEESDPSDKEASEGEGSSDGEWNPTQGFLPTQELTKEFEEETEDEYEEEEEFDSPSGLKINELCTECGRFFNVQKSHTCEHKIKPFSCNICGKRCVTEISLKHHSKIHDETYEHPCKYCHVTFKTRVDKLKHEQIHQDNQDPYKCPDCPETFATNKERNVHLSNHRTPKEFRCGVCAIEFKDAHHLRRHSVVHTGLKPYKCSVCQRSFSQSSHLKSHMRLHTGERPYKCQHCDKSFNHNVSLKSHIHCHHTSRSGSGRKKDKISERQTDTGDAEDNENKRGTDSDFDTDEEVQKESKGLPKSRRRSTGRPKGRPRRNSEDKLPLSGQNEEQRSKTKTPKSKVQKLKKIVSSDEKSEDNQSDGTLSSEEKQEEDEEEKQTMKKSTGRPRKRPNNDSDTDFHPEENAKKKRYSSSKNLGKSSGRQRKDAVV